MKSDVIFGTVGVCASVLSAANIYAAVSTVATIICAAGIVIGWGVKFYRIIKKWRKKEISTETAIDEAQKLIEEEIKDHANSNHHE